MILELPPESNVFISFIIETKKSQNEIMTPGLQTFYDWLLSQCIHKPSTLEANQNQHVLIKR